MDPNGCIAKDYVNISYRPAIYVPNTFIPDGNNLNEVFKIYGGNIKEMECFIFNRWGELIHTLNSINDFWDGTYKGEICQDGTYTWKLNYKDFQFRKYELTGHVNLLR
jgi:gliding motility-associated-like protein